MARPHGRGPHARWPNVRPSRGPASWWSARYWRAIFGIAFWLNPYDADGKPRTMATHTQLGMPPCNFVLMTGKPCPSCGMTTSFALLVRGDVRASLRANWAGTLIAVLWAALHGLGDRQWHSRKPLFIPRGRGELILTACVGVVLVLMLGRWTGSVLIGGIDCTGPRLLPLIPGGSRMTRTFRWARRAVWARWRWC